MKKITKYVADDGSEFNSLDECEKYELHCKHVSDVMKGLGETPELPGCGFSNGDGYLQHEEKTFMDVRTKLLEIAKQFTDHKWIQQTIDKGLDAHPSYAGRIIDECTTSPLRRAWYRIMCVDTKFREWGQPYYANYPEQAKNVRLN